MQFFSTHTQEKTGGEHTLTRWEMKAESLPLSLSILDVLFRPPNQLVIILFRVDFPYFSKKNDVFCEE